MLQLGVHTLQLKDVCAERRSKILCAATKTQRNQINIFKEICVAIALQPQKVIQRTISTVDGYCLVCITEDDRKQEVKMFTDKKQTVDSEAMVKTDNSLNLGLNVKICCLLHISGNAR